VLVRRPGVAREARKGDRVTGLEGVEMRALLAVGVKLDEELNVARLTWMGLLG
jgi:hypothetical protein